MMVVMMVVMGVQLQGLYNSLTTGNLRDYFSCLGST